MRATLGGVREGWAVRAVATAPATAHIKKRNLVKKKKCFYII
jgi:hypothetical protein